MGKTNAVGSEHYENWRWTVAINSVIYIIKIASVCLSGHLTLWTLSSPACLHCHPGLPGLWSKIGFKGLTVLCLRACLASYHILLRCCRQLLSVTATPRSNTGLTPTGHSITQLWCRCFVRQYHSRVVVNTFSCVDRVTVYTWSRQTVSVTLKNVTWGDNRSVTAMNFCVFRQKVLNSSMTGGRQNAVDRDVVEVLKHLSRPRPDGLTSLIISVLWLHP